MLAPVTMTIAASAPMLAVLAAQMTPPAVAAPYPAAMAQSRAWRRRHAIAANGTQVSRLNDHSGVAASATAAARRRALRPRLMEGREPASARSLISVIRSPRWAAACGARYQRNWARRCSPFPWEGVTCGRMRRRWHVGSNGVYHWLHSGRVAFSAGIWVYGGTVILVAATKRRAGRYPKRPPQKPWWAWRPGSRRAWLLAGSVLAAVAGVAAVAAWWLATPSRYVPPPAAAVPPVRRVPADRPGRAG